MKRRDWQPKLPEAEYERELTKLANRVDTILTLPDGIERLRQYVETAEFDLWATRVAQKMIVRVANNDRSMWLKAAKEMSAAMRREIREAPTGIIYKDLLDVQKGLIRSIPLDAAERVQELSTEVLVSGRRSSSIIEAIQNTGQVTRSHAQLIARTEVSRCQTMMTQARAMQVGSTHYMWMTAGDLEVRAGHRKMRGVICEWARPPAVENGSARKSRIIHHHPGCIWRCRCYPVPIFNDRYER